MNEGRSSGRRRKSGLLEEFRTFALRGNVIDLAVGVVMGAAFGAVVTSLVQDVLTPLLGVFGSPDFRDELVFQVGEAEFRLGLFLNALISLITIAAAVFFFVIKPVNELTERRKSQAPVQSTVRECPFCLSSIPKKASRCAFCTSEVDPQLEAANPEASPS